MTEWQKRTVYFVWENPRFLHTITGPPGTGKSTFIAILSRMLNILGFKVLFLASSNVAVDALMGKAKRYDAEDQAIRSHSLQSETSLTKKASGKAKSSKPRATIPSSSFPADNQGTFPRGANILQTSGVGLLCGWNAAIGSMRAQYPTVPPPTVEQLQHCLRSGMAQFSNAQFDEATLSQLTAENNLASDQIQLGLHIWGILNGLNLVLGIITAGTEARLETYTDPNNISALWVHNDSNCKEMYSALKAWCRIYGIVSAMKPWVTDLALRL